MPACLVVMRACVTQITGASLPPEVLPVRVSRLCEEVGVPCGESPSWEEMAQLVKTVAEQVGVAL